MIRLATAAIYRRIGRRIPYAQHTESLMLLCKEEQGPDYDVDGGITPEAARQIAELVLGEGWQCFYPITQEFSPHIITTPGICGERSLMEDLKDELLAYRMLERKQALLQKHGKELKAPLPAAPDLLHAYLEDSYSQELITALRRRGGKFFLTGIEYPQPGGFLLFPSEDEAHWIERLSPMIDELRLKDVYSL